MPWPQSQDYNEAIQASDASFFDPELRGGHAVANAMGIPMPRSGNFADVYEFEGASGAKWAIKCFTRRVSGLQERYGEISKSLATAKLPFSVNFTYLPKGIRIGQECYPVLKMQWVEGLLLNEFARNNLGKRKLLNDLVYLWVVMARRLRAAGIAHGDLQHGNVMLVPGRKAQSVALKLIDYDGMYVPALADQESGEVGHPAYQHPQRLDNAIYGPEVDRLAFLSIACALAALAVGGKALWDRYDNGDNLLFREADLRAPARSELFHELWKSPNLMVRTLVGHLAMGLALPAVHVPLVSDLVTNAGVVRLTAEQEEWVSSVLGERAWTTRRSAVPAETAAEISASVFAPSQWPPLPKEEVLEYAEFVEEGKPDGGPTQAPPSIPPTKLRNVGREWLPRDWKSSRLIIGAGAALLLIGVGMLLGVLARRAFSSKQATAPPGRLAKGSEERKPPEHKLKPEAKPGKPTSHGIMPKGPLAPPEEAAGNRNKNLALTLRVVPFPDFKHFITCLPLRGTADLVAVVGSKQVGPVSEVPDPAKGAKEGSFYDENFVLGAQDRTDCPTRPGCSYKRIDITLLAGKTYVIEMKRKIDNSVFDPFLVLCGRKENCLAKDDDGAGNLNARIVFRCVETGIYSVYATTLARRMYGAFNLRISETAGGIPKSGRPIAWTTEVRTLEIGSGKVLKSANLPGMVSFGYSTRTKQLIGRRGDGKAIVFFDPFAGAVVEEIPVSAIPPTQAGDWRQGHIAGMAVSSEGRLLAYGRMVGVRDATPVFEVIVMELPNKKVICRVRTESNLFGNILLDEGESLVAFACSQRAKTKSQPSSKTSVSFQHEIRSWNIRTGAENARIALLPTALLSGQPFIVRGQQAIGVLQHKANFAFYDAKEGHQRAPFFLLPNNMLLGRRFMLSTDQKLLVLTLPDAVSVLRIPSMTPVLTHRFLPGNGNVFQTAMLGPGDDSLLVLYSANKENGPDAACLEVVPLNEK